jgi:hypothetical protein
MQSSDWAARHSDELRQCLASGMSFSRIADAINAKFGTAYTRNAVIGRATRMGLANPGWSSKLPGEPRKPKAPLFQKLRERPAAKDRPIPRVRKAAKAIKAAELRSVGIEPRHLSVTELERGDCRYPYGGDAEGEAITFCGHPRQPDTSYCPAHFRLTRGPGIPPGTSGLRRFAEASGAIPVRIVALRMKRLPRVHRIAHLRALIGREPAGSRRGQLAALLRDEFAARRVEEIRAV